jgi:threonine dehydrogenase-like Zn-dependent dehydrogenase
VAHESQLVEVPAAMSDRQAVLTDPLACSLHAVLRSRVGQGGQSAGQTKGVLVYGAGIVGLGVVWGLRAAGYTGAIDVVARYAHQRQWAARLGASRVLELPASAQARFAAVAARTGARLTRARFGNFMLSGGYDLVFECVGASTTIEEALKWTRARGQAVLVSTGHGRQADLTPVWFRELEVIGAYGRSEEAFRGRKVHTYQLAHELMLAGKIDLSGLVTHTFALEDYKAALATAMHKGNSGALKVAFAFPPD